jgi:hypothetical protein
MFVTKSLVRLEPTQVRQFLVLHSRVGSWPYPKTIDQTEKSLLGTNNLAYYENP